MIHIAIVGMGGMGKTHIQNLSLMPDARITDICDPNPGAEVYAQEVKAQFHSGLDELLKNTIASVVILCTPTYLHYRQIKMVLAAGKHCIVEKPLCLSSREGRELFQLAQAQNCHIYVGQVMRFWEEYEYAFRLVTEKVYGETLDAEFHRLTAQPQWSAGNWLFDKEKSGLIPFDLHIHDVDFMVSLFGKPDRMTVQTGGIDPDGHLSDFYRVMYFYSRHTVCTESSWYRAPIPFTQGFRIYFEKALLTYDGEKLMLYPRDGDPQQIVLSGETQKIKTSINVAPTNAYFREVEYFLGCAARNAPAEKIPMEQVITVLEVIEELVGEPRQG